MINRIKQYAVYMYTPTDPSVINIITSSSPFLPIASTTYSEHGISNGGLTVMIL